MNGAGNPKTMVKQELKKAAADKINFLVSKGIDSVMESSNLSESERRGLGAAKEMVAASINFVVASAIDGKMPTKGAVIAFVMKKHAPLIRTLTDDQSAACIEAIVGFTATVITDAPTIIALSKTGLAATATGAGVAVGVGAFGIAAMIGGFLIYEGYLTVNQCMPAVVDDPRMPSAPDIDNSVTVLMTTVRKNGGDRFLNAISIEAQYYDEKYRVCRAP